VTGEIESAPVSTRLLIPTSAQPLWPPFRRVAESIASQGRQSPTHAHELEEVLTYVTEGFASYQLEGGAADSLPHGSARLLTAPVRVRHRVAPAQGAVIRWFNLVVGLTRGASGPTRLQSAGPGTPSTDVDNVRVSLLVGPRAPMTSSSGLECQEMVFAEPSTTFLRVGRTRRALLYTLAGEGAVDQRELSAGAGALVEGVPGVAVQGRPGFRAIFASAPTGPETSPQSSESD
jgi:redox-sensitive bicupin YhaK (pirin superfamily)